jgi:hypothetical protein
VDVVMMDCAKRDGELITDLEAEPWGLRVANVVRVRGGTSADEARLAGNKAQMLLAANSLRFTECENAFVDLWAGTSGKSRIACAFAVVRLLPRFSGLTNAMAHRFRWFTS